MFRFKTGVLATAKHKSCWRLNEIIALIGCSKGDWEVHMLLEHSQLPAIAFGVFLAPHPSITCPVARGDDHASVPVSPRLPSRTFFDSFMDLEVSRKYPSFAGRAFLRNRGRSRSMTASDSRIKFLSLNRTHCHAEVSGCKPGLGLLRLTRPLTITFG